MDKMSIVVPCYNEEKTIQFFYDAMLELAGILKEAELEFIFVDDGSRDKTYEALVALHEKDDRVKCISFSRNFGKEAAIFSGIRAVSGDCCVVMDADLQHPPSAIPEMYRLWKEGYEVVEGIKSSRGRESFLHRWFANTFYSIISRLIGMDMMNSSDFKLMDRKVINELSRLGERNTFFRALSYWVGFKSTTVPYEVQERVAGETKWSFFSLLNYAVRNLISFTYIPLYFIVVLGILILVLGLIVGVDTVVSVCRGNTVGGYPTLTLLILLVSGALMVSLGIIGTYIAKIYDEVKHRPQYIIRDKKE